MGTTSPRLNLTLPAGGDQFSRQQLNNNFSLIDAQPGVFPCTSTTRPVWAAAQAGQLIVETDTRRVLEWDGAAWHDPQVAPPAWVRSMQPGSEIELASNQVFTYNLGSITVRRPGSLAVIYHVNAEQNRYSSFGLSLYPLIDNKYAGVYPVTGNNYLNDGREYSQWHTYGTEGLWDDFRVISFIGIAPVTAGTHTLGIKAHSGQGSGSIVRMNALAFLVNSTDV